MSICYTSGKFRSLHLTSAILAGTLYFISPEISYASENSEGSPQEAAVPSDDLRLETIGYRLAKANDDVCDKPLMLTGLLLHDISNYAASYRSEVTLNTGMTFGFGVRDLVPGSVADAAGLKRGDEIIAVNGATMADFAPDLITPDKSFARMARFLDYLDAQLQKGPAQLTILRGATRISVSLQGARGCGGRFVVMPDSALNAWSDGHYVAVTTEMMHFASEDRELAFVVAHEMSHNILHHADVLKDRSHLLEALGIGTIQVRKTEAAADAYAIRLMHEADYDLTAPERFLRHVGRVTWLPQLLMLDLGLTHPSISARIAIVNQAISDLRAKDDAPVATMRLALAPAPFPRAAEGISAIPHPLLSGLFAGLNGGTAPAIQPLQLHPAPIFNARLDLRLPGAGVTGEQPADLASANEGMPPLPRSLQLPAALSVAAPAPCPPSLIDGQQPHPDQKTAPLPVHDTLAVAG